MKNFKTLSSFLSIVTTSTLIMTPIIANSLETSTAVKQIKENLSNDNKTLKTQQENIKLLYFLSNKKYDFESFKKLANQVVTDQQVEQFKTDILNKIAASIYTLGNSKSWAPEQTKQVVLQKCGIFLKNFQNQKEGLNLNETDQEQTNIGLYKYLQSEEDAINIDIFDSYDAQLTVDSIKDKFNESLNKMNDHKLSDEHKKTLSSKFSNIFDGYVDYARKSYFSQLEFDFGLLDLQGNYKFFQNFVQPLNREKNDCTYQNFTKSIAEQQLKLVMSNFIDYYRDSIQLNNEGRSFLSCIKDYSDNGYLSANSNNNLVKTEDLSKLFTFKYDYLQGTRLTKPNFDYNILATDTEELKDDIDIKEILPIQNFKAFNGSQYENGELYPGYLAHFRVVNLIDDQDDSQCDISLEIGVSDSIRDPNSEHILWLSDYNKELDTNNDDANETEFQTFHLTVDSITEKRYIAKNTFYKGLTAELHSDEYNKDTDEYYESTASERSYINDILDAKAEINEDGSYNISNESPIYLYGTDVKGIPAPELPSSFKQELNTNDSSLTSFIAYKHQFLRFMVTDYSTNITDMHKLALYGHWVIMSDSPSTLEDTNETKILKQAPVYDIPWSNNDNENIWVSYQIDQSLLNTLSDVLGFSSIVNEYIEHIEPSVLSLDENTSSTNGKGKTPIQAATEQKDLNITTTFFNSILVPLLIASLQFCVSMAVILWQKVVAVAAYGIAIAAHTIMAIVEGIWTGIFNSSLIKTKNDILPTVKAIKSDVHEQGDDIVSNYQKIIESRLNFHEKRNAVSRIYEDIGLNDDGSQVISQTKLDNANDWFEKVKSLVEDKIDEKLKLFYKEKFIFAKGLAKDFKRANDAYYTMSALTIPGIVSVLVGIIPTFINVWNAVTNYISFSIHLFGSWAPNTPSYVIITGYNLFKSFITKTINNFPNSMTRNQVYTSYVAGSVDGSTAASVTAIMVITVASTLIEIVNTTLSFIETYGF